MVRLVFSGDLLSGEGVRLVMDCSSWLNGINGGSNIKVELCEGVRLMYWGSTLTVESGIALLVYGETF